MKNTIKAKIVTKGKPKIRFTKEDEKIILKQVELYPTNLRHAFSEAANLLEGRDWKSIQYRYYKVLRPDREVKVITCGSKAAGTQNVKNLARDGEGNMPEQNLKGYLWVMKEMLDLSPTERDMIVNFFHGPTTINIRKRTKAKE